MSNTIIINPIWAYKQSMALRELYKLREESLHSALCLLNEPYVNELNSEYMTRLAKKTTELYNELTELSQQIENM